MNKYTELGTIEISNTIIAKVIKNVILSDDSQKVYLANASSEIILGGNKKTSSKEILKTLDIKFSKNEIRIAFFGICRFGYIIENEANKLLKKIADEITALFPDQKLELKCVINGVISKQISPRYLEYYLNYEP